MELPHDILFTIAEFIDLKDLCKFKVSKLCEKIVDAVLNVKFNVHDDNKKYILNCNMENLVFLIKVVNFKFIPELILINVDALVEYDVMCLKLQKPFYREFNDHYTFKNMSYNKLHIYFGIPYDEEQLFLYSISTDDLCLFNLLIKNKMKIKDYYLFVAIIAKSNNFYFLKRLIDNGANPYFKLNGKNLLKHATDNLKLNCNFYLYTEFNMRYDNKPKNKKIKLC
jgi:hypothetical protein